MLQFMGEGGVCIEQSNEEQNFCINVRSLRLLHKLSQKEMAQALGIGVKNLRKLEAGEIPPRLGTAVLLLSITVLGFG